MDLLSNQNKKELFKLVIREFHERTLPDIVERELSIPHDTDKVITIYGSRRVGKTYFFYQTIHTLIPLAGKERIVYVNLEDERLLPLAVKDLQHLVEGYYELYPGNRHELVYLFLDEIRVVPGWEVFIRRLEETRKFRIFVTGSSARLMSREIATALRGRTLSYRLMPLSFREYLRFGNVTWEPSSVKYSGVRFDIKKAFSEYLEWGGYPEVAGKNPFTREETLKSYFEMIIFRDLVERFSVRNSRFMNFLLKYLLTNVSTLLSVNNLHRTLEEGLRPSRETIQEYLAHILETEHVFLVPKFSYSLKVQEKNPKKIYVLDNGLRRTSAFLFSADHGRLAENIVFLELFRKGFELYYWKEKKEVDFIARKGEQTTAFNVCYEDVVPPREIEGLKMVRSSGLECDRLYLITRDTEQDIDGIRCLPLWQWLLETDLHSEIP
jgi:predicted AAA+ superfamily ATPase